MLTKIAHRISNLDELEKIPNNCGIEFDLHAYENKLVICHDAFEKGIQLESFLCNQNVKNRILAVNIKEEGIEEKAIETLSNHNVQNFFLFDVSFPQIYRLGKNFSSNLALRISQLEKIDIYKCRDFASFLWVDTFDGKFWLNFKEITELKKLDYKLCFVSPELHRPPIGDFDSFYQSINSFMDLLGDDNYICTKFINDQIN